MGFILTFKQHGHQRSSVAVLGLLNKQLSILQHVTHRIAPFNDAVHNVARIILLIRTKCLDQTESTLQKRPPEHYSPRARFSHLRESHIMHAFSYAYFSYLYSPLCALTTPTGLRLHE